MLPVATTDGQGLGIIDALFTSTSATCVTGLIVVTTGTAFTLFGQTVIMILIQIGGLGIMTMSTAFAFLMGRKITLRHRLIIQEDLNQFGISGLLRLVQYVLGFTFAIEGAGALLLFTRLVGKFPLPKAIFYSIFHSVSAFNNAGFDLFGNSLVDFVGDPIINITVMLLIILGGLGFYVLVELFQKRKVSSLQSKMVISTTAVLLIVGFFVVFALEFSNTNTIANLNFGEKILASAFLSVTPRTAGFNTVPTGALNQSTIFFVMLLMFIGASPGSTGGGIKTTTIGTIFSTLWTTITGKNDVELFKRRLDGDIIFKAVTILMLSLFLVLIVTLILLVTESGEFIDILFETVSAYGTVGLSTGLTPTLTKVGRVLITITMFAGRVGPLTLAVAMSVSANSKGQILYHYPKEKIMVG